MRKIKNSNFIECNFLKSYDIWNSYKKKYLLTAIIGSSFLFVAAIFCIIWFSFAVQLNSKTLSESEKEYFSQTAFLLFMICIVLFIIYIPFVLINRGIAKIIFSFSEGEKIKMFNLKYFFKTNYRFNYLIYLHLGISGGIIATIIYKNIENNLKESLNN